MTQPAPRREAHTPGPWYLGKVTTIDLNTDEMIDDDENGYVTAGPIGNGDYECEINIEGTNAAANARLIAAAPDLLAALKDCANAMYADNLADGWKEIIENALTAIAAATGGAP